MSTLALDHWVIVLPVNPVSVGKVLCAGDDAGVVRLFDAETGALLFTAPALLTSIASLSWIRESTPVEVRFSLSSNLI